MHKESEQSVLLYKKQIKKLFIRCTYSGKQTSRYFLSLFFFSCFLFFFSFFFSSLTKLMVEAQKVKFRLPDLRKLKSQCKC